MPKNRARQRPYEGVDDFLIDEPFCLHCDVRFRRMKLCSTCQLVYYCSIECEKECSAYHPKECLSLAVARIEEEARAAELLNVYNHDLGRYENLFHSSLGDFWIVLQAQPYNEAKRKLANLTCSLAENYGIRFAYEKSVRHYLELLRLDVMDEVGIRYNLPIMLLNLNRDDDLYSFCRYWILNNEDYEIKLERHKLSHEGDWLYPKEQGIKYNNIFDDLAAVSFQEVHGDSLQYFLALYIMKARILAVHVDRSRSMYHFLRTTGSKIIEEADSIVVDYFVGTSEEHILIRAQQEQVEKLLEYIHSKNKSVFPGIINPSPLLSQRKPRGQISGTPNEAYLLLKEFRRLFTTIPGLMDSLRSKFGNNPTYPCTLVYQNGDEDDEDGSSIDTGGDDDD